MERLVSQRTGIINQIRAFLLERGRRPDLRGLIGDFHNKIGPKRRLLRDTNTCGVEGKADVTASPSK